MVEKQLVQKIMKSHWTASSEGSRRGHSLVKMSNRWAVIRSMLNVKEILARPVPVLVLYIL